MALMFRRLMRGSLLGLMLLLAGAANLVCISYDADDDEDTPPVSIELNIVAPCKRSVQVPKLQTHARVSRLEDEQPATEQLAMASFDQAPQLQQGPPQMIIPLRR
jgi:hypothetical protein